MFSRTLKLTAEFANISADIIAEVHLLFPDSEHLSVSFHICGMKHFTLINMIFALLSHLLTLVCCALPAHSVSSALIASNISRMSLTEISCVGGKKRTRPRSFDLSS